MSAEVCKTVVCSGKLAGALACLSGVLGVRTSQGGAMDPKKVEKFVTRAEKLEKLAMELVADLTEDAPSEGSLDLDRLADGR